MSPDIAGMWLSAEVADVQALQLRLRRVLEEGGTILTLALLYPMPVYAESTSVDDLEFKILHILVPQRLYIRRILRFKMLFLEFLQD